MAAGTGTITNRMVAIPHAKYRVVNSVSVHCNTPVSFSLKEWDVYFPHPLRLKRPTTGKTTVGTEGGI